MTDGARAELAAEEGDEVGLRRVLRALVDRVEVESDERGDWVKMTKSLEAQA
jgi:hypothetical protein